MRLRFLSLHVEKVHLAVTKRETSPMLCKHYNDDQWLAGFVVGVACGTDTMLTGNNSHNL